LSSIFSSIVDPRKGRAEIIENEVSASDRALLPDHQPRDAGDKSKNCKGGENSEIDQRRASPLEEVNRGMSAREMTQAAHTEVVHAAKFSQHGRKSQRFSRLTLNDELNAQGPADYAA
jgi:hypothetical protein